MARMLIKAYPNYNGCRPGVCYPVCETPKPWEVKKRRRIARRKEEQTWRREYERGDTPLDTWFEDPDEDWALMSGPYGAYVSLELHWRDPWFPYGVRHGPITLEDYRRRARIMARVWRRRGVELEHGISLTAHHPAP